MHKLHQEPQPHQVEQLVLEARQFFGSLFMEDVEVDFHFLKRFDNPLKVLDKDVHIGASPLDLVRQIILAHHGADLSQKHLDLVKFEVLQSLLKNVLQLVLALLDEDLETVSL